MSKENSTTNNNSTPENKPTLVPDRRFGASLPVGQYLCRITGASLSPIVIEKERMTDDGLEIILQKKLDLYVSPIQGPFKNAFDGIFTKANKLPLYYESSSSEHGKGGLSDMVRIRLGSIDETMAEYLDAKKKHYEDEGLEVPEVLEGPDGSPIDETISAVDLFLNCELQRLVGSGFLVVEFNQPKLYMFKKNMSVRDWTWPVKGIPANDLYRCEQNGTISIKPGYVTDDGKTAYFFPYPEDANGNPLVGQKNAMDHTKDAPKEPEPYPVSVIRLLFPNALIVDANQKPGKHEALHEALSGLGFDLFYGHRLSVGDYMAPNHCISVDTKSGMEELAHNLSNEDIDRFERELARAKLYGIQLIILVNAPELDKDDFQNSLDRWTPQLCQDCSSVFCDHVSCAMRPGHVAPLPGREIRLRMEELTWKYPVSFIFTNSEERQAELIAHYIKNAPVKNPPAQFIIGEGA